LVPAAMALVLPAATGAMAVMAAITQRGGIVKGKGGPRSDSVTAKLSPGEAVVNEPAVKAAGKRVIYRLNKIGNTSESAGMKRQQAKRLVSGKLTVR